MSVKDQISLRLNVDSCEFCPEVKGLLAVGCYQLNEETSTREGELLLFSVTDDVKLTKQDTLSVPGIFDLKWGKQQQLAVASCSGSIDVFQVTPSGHNLLPLVSSPPVPNGMTLSISWNNTSTEIAGSYSSGGIHIYQQSPGTSTLSSTWHNDTAHTYECWTVHFHREDPNLLFSGADDCHLNVWDVRADPGRPAAVTSTHTYVAGVTTVESSKRLKDYVVVGSYDESVRLWDKRNLKKAVSVVDVGGGVWRLKAREDDNRIAVAAMRGFFKILSFNGSELTITEEYNQVHQSLAYGIDWMWGDTTLLASASFYDSLLSLWSSNQNLTN